MLFEKDHEFRVVRINRFLFAPSVTFPFVQSVEVRNATRAESRDDGFGLVGRHDLIIRSLKNSDRVLDLFGVEVRRAFAVEICSVGKGSDQRVHIT